MVEKYVSLLTNPVNKAYYDWVGPIDKIYAGTLVDGTYTGELSILAHEFTHGVNHREGNLGGSNEPGALNESFADIFGFLTRRYVTGSVNWEIGVPTSLLIYRRNLQNPSSAGFHYDFVGGVASAELPGQPDTYEGMWWQDWTVNGIDVGGVHVNCGVQNHWFYVLSSGETGTNDLGNNYSVNGIGIDKAALISYYNLTNNISQMSVYDDAMEGAIAAALYYYGECSFEHTQTQMAWYAVGLGDGSDCANAGINVNENSFNIYPNPATNYISVAFEESEFRTIQIYSTNGQLMKTINDGNLSQYQIDVSNLPSGTYILYAVGAAKQIGTFVKI
jgi:hypothetical protein